MKQILKLFKPGDLIKVGDEVYLVISNDKIKHDDKIRGFHSTWWTLLLDTKGNFFDIDSDLLSRCAEVIAGVSNE